MGRHDPMGDEGLEQSAETAKETAISETGGAESGARPNRDPMLAKVIEAWPGLSSDARRAIVAIVKGGVARVVL
jgi:hypothetical protein